MFELFDGLIKCQSKSPVEEHVAIRVVSDEDEPEFLCKRRIYHSAIGRNEVYYVVFITGLESFLITEKEFKEDFILL